MTLDEIKTAVNEGKRVHWATEIYEVRVDAKTKEYYIICLHNNHIIGLTWSDGVTLNGTEDQFFINQSEPTQNICYPVQTLDQHSAFGQPFVLVGIRLNPQGVELNLPAHTPDKKFGPNVYIERRQGGWSINISPLDGDEITTAAFLKDNGAMQVKDETGRVIQMVYAPLEEHDMVYVLRDVPRYISAGQSAAIISVLRDSAGTTRGYTLEWHETEFDVTADNVQRIEG